MVEKSEMPRKLANNIHKLFLENYYDDDVNILFKIASLINELLSDKKIEKRFMDLIIRFEDKKIKTEIFTVIRNILSHFPIFDKWEDIYLTYDLVTWNNPKYSSIVNFFEEYKGTTINYIIYNKYKGILSGTREIELEVPDLKKGFFLKDFISYHDMQDIFALIYYLLIDFDIDPDELSYFPSI